MLIGTLAEAFLSNLAIYILLLSLPAFAITIQNHLLINHYNFDTPRWLQYNQRNVEIQQLLQKIYKPWAWQPRLHKIELEDGSDHKNTAPVLISNILRNPMMLSYILCMLQQFSGINVIFLYSKMIFKNSEQFVHQSSYLTLVLGFVNFLVVLPNLIFIEKYGRKILLLQGLLGLSISYLLYSILAYFVDDTFQIWIKLMVLLLVICFYETSLGPVIWIYITEILTIGWVGSSITIQWICAAFIAATYPILFEYNFDKDIDLFFLVCSVICFFGFIFVYKIAQETRNMHN